MKHALPRISSLVAAVLPFALCSPAGALDYQTTTRPALMYDAPSTTAAKIAVAANGVPLEVVVEGEHWLKVREPGGRLAWIERSALGGARSVMVKADAASVRKDPRADAPVVFSAVRGVLLQTTGAADAYGWLPVKHVDGLAGWIPLREVWGQ